MASGGLISLVHSKQNTYCTNFQAMVPSKLTSLVTKIKGSNIGSSVPEQSTVETNSNRQLGQKT